MADSDELVDMIAFDPARDITVQPWLEQRLDRPLRQGDVIVGGRREETVGAELLLFGKPLTVYGKLGKTAVGTHETRSVHLVRDAGWVARDDPAGLWRRRRRWNPTSYPAC